MIYSCRWVETTTRLIVLQQKLYFRPEKCTNIFVRWILYVLRPIKAPLPCLPDRRAERVHSTRQNPVGEISLILEGLNVNQSISLDPLADATWEHGVS